MFNVKNIIIGASVGFFLSFIIGLFSFVAFGFVILRAFIFAIVGAGIGYGCSFVFGKFLNSGSDSVEVSSSAGVHSSSASEKKGGVVDIVIDDENLDDDTGGPKFVLSKNSQFISRKRESTSPASSTYSAPISKPELQESQVEATPVSVAAQETSSQAHSPAPTVAAPASAPTESAKPSGFQPLNMATTAPKVEVAEDSGESAVVAPIGSGLPGIDGLDVLPEIADLSVGSDSKKNESSDIISDSEFASDGGYVAPKETVSFPGGKSTAEADTNEMAMAIRTLLAKDN